MPEPSRSDIYGSRVRIGYTSPPLTTEVFPYEFYRIVPDGANASALIFEGRELRWQGPTLNAAATRQLARRLCREDSGAWKGFAAAMESDSTLR